MITNGKAPKGCKVTNSSKVGRAGGDESGYAVRLKAHFRPKVPILKNNALVRSPTFWARVERRERVGGNSLVMGITARLPHIT